MADSNTVNVGTGADLGTTTGVEARFVRVDGQINSIKTDVAGVKSDVGEIKSVMNAGFKEIGAKVEAKGAPNHFAIGLIITVLLALLGWGWALFGNFQGRNETAIGELKAQISKFETRDEIDKVSGLQEKIADLKAQIVDGKVARLAADVADAQAKIVPLSTHQELWSAQREANKTLAARIDENSRALADITAPKDTISRFDRRLGELEALARGRTGRPE